MSIKNLPIPLQGFDDHDSFTLEPTYGTMFRNVRSNRRRVVRAPGATLLAPSPVPSGITSAVASGSFSTPIVTGSVVYTHTLGSAPLGYMFIGADTTGPRHGPRVSTIQNSVATMIGYSDGTTHGVTARSAVNASSPTQANQATATASCILLINPAGTTVVAGVITASGATTFTINWTTVDTDPHIIGYTIVGGSGVTAKVVNWTFPVSTGNVAVTGTGFIPQIVFHLKRGGGRSLAFGAMTSAAVLSSDAHIIDASSPTTAEKLTSATKAIAWLTGIVSLAPQIEASATFVSMDANGFTVNVDNAPGSTHTMTSLCIVGMSNAKVGTFVKTTASAPVTQAVTGIGFQPDWVLLAGTGATNNNPQSNAIRSFGFGQVSATSVFAEMVQNGTATKASEEMVDSALFIRLNTSRTEVVSGTLQSLDTDGCTINWALNDSVAERIGYVVLKGGASGGVGVIRNYPELFVGTTTAVEKFVMLTSTSAFIYTPVDSSTGTWTGTAEAYTGGPDKRFSIANTQGVSAWSQGVDNIRQWDGINFTDLVTSGTNHAARALLAFADRIVSVRPFYTALDHPTQIRWCMNGNLNNWSGTGSGTLEIIETSQSPLVTGFVLNDHAYLAKERELIELIWTGTESPVFGTQPRVRGMGILAPHSVGLGEQVAFWLGPDDVYMWDGSTLTAIGDRVYNTIDALIDYTSLDQIQGAVWTPDSLYLLVVPPYLFVYDYRRDIWYQDDTVNFEAIGIFGVGTNFTADIDHSEFIVIGDAAMQTVRLSQTLTDYLGTPIDSYFTTKDYTAEQLVGGSQKGFAVTLWDLNSLREIRFQSNAGNIVEVGVSTDRGVTWQTTMVTVNQTGVGVAWFQVPFSQIRFRFRDYGTDAYEIHGSWAFDIETAGYQYG